MRSAPAVDTARPATMTAIATARGTSSAVPVVPRGVPARNHGADAAIAPHHVAVAAVTTTMTTARARASAASHRRTRRVRSTWRPTVTATTVQAARQVTASATQARNATPYPPL